MCLQYKPIHVAKVIVAVHKQSAHLLLNLLPNAFAGRTASARKAARNLSARPKGSMCNSKAIACIASGRHPAKACTCEQMCLMQSDCDFRRLQALRASPATRKPPPSSECFISALVIWQERFPIHRTVGGPAIPSSQNHAEPPQPFLPCSAECT